MWIAVKPPFSSDLSLDEAAYQKSFGRSFVSFCLFAFCPLGLLNQNLSLLYSRVVCALGWLLQVAVDQKELLLQHQCMLIAKTTGEGSKSGLRSRVAVWSSWVEALLLT